MSSLQKDVFARFFVGQEQVGIGTHWPTSDDTRVRSDPKLAQKMSSWLNSFIPVKPMTPAPSQMEQLFKTLANELNGGSKKRPPSPCRETSSQQASSGDWLQHVLQGY